MNKRKEQLDVVLDIDGCMADFEPEYCRRFGYENRHLVNLYERHPDPQLYWPINKFLNSTQVYKNLLPLPIGIEIARWLCERVTRFERRESRAHVEIVSSRPITMTKLTQEWLEYEKVPYHSLTVRPDKEAYIIRKKPDIIVDDIISVCQIVQEGVPDVQPVLIAHEWNETRFLPRITTLKQFQQIYQKVANEKLLTDTSRIGLAEDVSGL